MKALLVTFGSILAPRGGLQVRARTTLETLQFLGADVRVVSTEEPAQPAAFTVLRRRPFYGWSPGLVGAVAAAGRGRDLVVVENAMLMPAVAMARLSAPIVWDTNECQTLHYMRLPGTPVNRLRLAVWRGLEAFAARRCRLAVAIGEAEAEWWRRLYPRLTPKLSVVDHAPWLGGDRDGSGARVGHGLGEGPLLVFAGTMAAKHNVAAGRWLAEVLAPALPSGVTLAIAGPGSERLALPAGGGGRVRLLGEVENLDALIAAADLCLAPLGAGAGVKTKILHYLAHGRPVAGTPVAFEGLTGAPGLLVRELPDLASAIAAWLSSSPEVAELGGRRREWVASHHGPGLVADQWRAVLARLGA